MNELTKPPSKWWHKALKALGVIVGAYLLYVLIFDIRAYLGRFQVEQFQERLEQQQRDAVKILRGDRYGGTPQETYESWLSALRKGDLVLASKYVNPSSRQEFLEWMQRRQKAGDLEEWLKQWPDWSAFYRVFGGKAFEFNEHEELKFEATAAVEIEKATTQIFPGSGGVGEFEVVFPPGPYKIDVAFWFNKEAGIWKIRQ